MDSDTKRIIIMIVIALAIGITLAALGVPRIVVLIAVIIVSGIKKLFDKL